MPTLQERFADLAEEAPETPTPPGLWVEGRRRARVRTAGTVLVVGATVVALLAVGGLASRRSTAGQEAARPHATPAIPSQIHHPSPWLAGTDGRPPGRLSVLIPGKRGGWRHYHWGTVGVSATTGAYHYLDIPGCVEVFGLAPDGRHVACYTGTGPTGDQVLEGLAAYDTVTGQEYRWTPAPGTLHLNSVAWSGNDALTFRAGHTSYEWRFGYGAPRPITTHLTENVGVAGRSGLYTLGRRGFFYLDPARDGRRERVRVHAAGWGRSTPVAVSLSGRRVALTSRTDTGSTLLVGDVGTDGRVRGLSRVPAAVRWPLVVGWADDQHLVVVNQISPEGPLGMDDPNARYALDRVDVDTGQVVQVAGMSDQQTSWGAVFATSLLGAPTRDFPAPPEPIDPRLEAGLAVGVLLTGGLALLWWRRRVRT